MKEVVVSQAMGDLDAIDKYEGKHPSSDDYDQLLERPVTVKTDTGAIVAIVVPVATCGTKAAYDIFKKFTYPSKNRQVATVGETSRVKKLDGSESGTTQLPPHLAPLTSIYGYVDRYARTPYARACMFNRDHPDLWQKVQPFIQSVDDVFKEWAPDRYRIQKAVAEEIPPDWIIGKTAFSTVTVNVNFSIAYHRDANDLKEGLGVMSHLSVGEYKHGELVVPRYRVAFNLKNRDVILFDVNQVHGVVPIQGPWGRFTRMTCVHYLREGLLRCGDSKHEINRGKRARSIGRLYDPEEIHMAQIRKQRAMEKAHAHN